MAVVQKGSTDIHQRHIFLPGQTLHRTGIPLLPDVDVAHVSQPAHHSLFIQISAPPVEKALAVQRRQVGKDGPDTVAPYPPDHLPVQLHKFWQRHVGLMVPRGVLRDLLPTEVAVIAAEVHHHHVAGQLPGQHPVQQAAALADRGSKVRVIMNGKLKFRFQCLHIDLIMSTVAPVTQINLDPLQDGIP